VTANWAIIGAHYRCQANNQGDLILDRSNRQIDSLAGKHQDWNTNANLKGVYIDDSKVLYFPLGLEKLIVNLEGIAIQKSKLKEISKDDLKEYKNLRLIDLYYNDIQFLEPNLFENNPNLKYIAFHDNKLAHIDAHVFDIFVGKLNVLLIARNICHLDDAWNIQQANFIFSKIQRGFCKDETKLPAAIITTTTTTTISAPSVNSAQLNDLKRELQVLKNKVNNQEIELKTFKEKLELTQTNVRVLVRHISEVKDNIIEKLTPRKN
jgi:Leucine rich repeat